MRLAKVAQYIATFRLAAVAPYPRTLEEKTIMTFSSSQWIPIQQWLLSFGADAMPLEPDWLVENWRNEIKKMSELSKI